MADIKEEKTRFDIYFFSYELFYAVEMKCVSFISLFMGDAFKLKSKLEGDGWSYFNLLFYFVSSKKRQKKEHKKISLTKNFHKFHAKDRKDNSYRFGNFPSMRHESTKPLPWFS